MIIIESKRKKPETILKAYPGAILADVTSGKTTEAGRSSDSGEVHSLSFPFHSFPDIKFITLVEKVYLVSGTLHANQNFKNYANYANLANWSDANASYSHVAEMQLKRLYGSMDRQIRL